MKNGRYCNWSELPPELTSLILVRLSVAEILDNAQKVCRSWRRLCKDPSMWRKIHMKRLETTMKYDFEAMCRHAVDRSQGGLLEIRIEGFGSDSLLAYIADRSSNLRSLGLTFCYPMSPIRLVKAVAKLALLEELEVLYSWRKLKLKSIGHACPRLKTLKLYCLGYRRSRFNLDADALRIAETMPELRHLRLLGNCLTDIGLTAILDSCPHLVHLDLRHSLNVNLDGNLEKRCSKGIKDFRYPNDFLDDYLLYPVRYSK